MSLYTTASHLATLKSSVNFLTPRCKGESMRGNNEIFRAIEVVCLSIIAGTIPLLLFLAIVDYFS